jgi:lysophospholipase L1-like esterase
MRRVLVGVALLLACVGIGDLMVLPTVAVSTPTRIMPLGDSITFGSNNPLDTAGYRGTFWTSLTGAGYSVDFVGSVSQGSIPDPATEAYPAYTINDITATLSTSLPTYRPEVILLLAGTGDCRDGITDAPARMTTMLNTIVAALPTAEVLVSTLPPVDPALGAGRVALTDAFNAALPGIVAAQQALGHRVRMVDAGSILTLADLDVGGVHPTQGGYLKMSNAWYASLQTVLPKRRQLVRNRGDS